MNSPIPDDLIQPRETDPTAHVEWIAPAQIDYAEADDENAHAAMEAERDALQARVTELERVNANLLRDIEYLNRKLEMGSAVLAAARAIVSPYTIQGNHGFYVADPEYRALENAVTELAQEAKS